MRRMTRREAREFLYNDVPSHGLYRGDERNYDRLYDPYHYIRKGHESEDWQKVGDVWCENLAAWGDSFGVLCIPSEL